MDAEQHQQGLAGKAVSPMMRRSTATTTRGVLQFIEPLPHIQP